MILKVVYPEIPPTSNKIYFRGTTLTKTAREYAERFAFFMATNHLQEISSMNPNGIYEMFLHFYFPTLVNPSWNDPDVAPSRRAKSRYKKIDLTNRIKLLEDCIRDAIAIDDCQTFESHQVKFHDPVNPRVEIFVIEANPDNYGIPRWR